MFIRNMALICCIVVFICSAGICRDKNPDKTSYQILIKGSKLLRENETNIMYPAQTCVIDLETNPTTGYDWYYTISETNNIRLLKEMFYQKSGKKLTGSPSRKVWKFQCVKKGIININLKYYRSWEGEDKTINAKKYYIIIKDKY